MTLPLLIDLWYGQAVKPSGRINACLAVGKDMLYLYGGMMEVKDREITLDDLYSLNLSKLDEWKCIISVSYKLDLFSTILLSINVIIYFNLKYQTNKWT